MVFKRFSISVFLRTVGICASAFVLVYLLTATTFVATTFIVALLIVGQAYSLVHYVQRTNREIARFFDSIQYSDFSQSFRSTVKGSAFEELNGVFSRVIDEFRKARTEKEEHYRYLQIVVQHIGMGLLAFTPDGEVELMNAAAKKLLKVPSLRNIRDLAPLSAALAEALEKIRGGDKVLVKMSVQNELSQLSIYATEFKLRENHYTLVSLTNIQSELEEREMQAWQNLIRVLTHEIMNSVTPIVSLSATASSMLATVIEGKDGGERGVVSAETAAGGDKGAELLEDVRSALETISKRSGGLLHFVDDYRNLTRIPVPNFQIVRVSDLFSRVEKLFSETFHEKKIAFASRVEPPDLGLTADPDLIEQVLINLILNCLSAVAAVSLPAITLLGKLDGHGGTLLQVVDNGVGVPEELLEKIFIPFFTTRKEGSGIGLSLSRQIMRAHKGGITVNSIPGRETTFTLRF
ncbi:MAG TPA: ATP-binding protein [Bacteroidota bacterium]|nr:ATP-binding protein [Bacteroidota bacterium]